MLEAYNLFNRPNWTITTQESSPQYLQRTSGENRTMQFGFRLTFWAMTRAQSLRPFRGVAYGDGAGSGATTPPQAMDPMAFRSVLVVSAKRCA